MDIMKTRAAVLYSMDHSQPYGASQPLAVEELDLVGPGPGCVLIEIDAALPLEIAALFGCAVRTGVGAVINSARVEPGSSVAVFGLGGVGLSVVLGARVAGAESIIAVDTMPQKLDTARALGATAA